MRLIYVIVVLENYNSEMHLVRNDLQTVFTLWEIQIAFFFICEYNGFKMRVRIGGVSLAMSVIRYALDCVKLFNSDTILIIWLN